ncbi:J domain-containing protein [Treponema phagedenis]|uniref:DnaJ domain protein n=1 Tax=Treponema phagedenis TaxID=162 RepID=A0A0B7H171_TREPH|nr:J domain-containing protein [Treponema phagedenis]EFW36889.1 DnaJ domain protein [Treponema phagedenis F0421]NVP23469.1 J domain-containing protein [Treponema phagedenis]QEJ95235.1 J domain-containing protein [Treponema phagedenis]QEJ98611.1 J domain-containing protein [Treponema phagedenis]QEK01089.1 J domain-containing protein [Treponema phagedenis]
MNTYYEKLGDILRDRLDSDEDPFYQWDNNRNGKYRTAAGTMERRPPPKTDYTKEKAEPIRIPVPPELVEDFAVLGIPSGMPLADCKQSWKRLVKRYHPDTITEVEKQGEAAAIIRRINRSYKRIEKWFETGRIPEDKEL